MVGVDDEILGQEIKVVVLRQVAALTPETIMVHLAQHLPAFMQPRYIEFADVLPKTETEKVQRHKLAYLNDAVIDMRADGRRRAPAAV